MLVSQEVATLEKPVTRKDCLVTRSGRQQCGVIADSQVELMHGVEYLSARDPLHQFVF